MVEKAVRPICRAFNCRWLIGLLSARILVMITIMMIIKLMILYGVWWLYIAFYQLLIIMMMPMIIMKMDERWSWWTGAQKWMLMADCLNWFRWSYWSEWCWCWWWYNTDDDTDDDMTLMMMLLMMVMPRYWYWWPTDWSAHSRLAYLCLANLVWSLPLPLFSAKQP